MSGSEADWLEKGEQKDDWTRPVMSAMSFTARESGSNVKHRLLLRRAFA